MQDRPTAAELLEAVQVFLEADVVPALDGTRKFHARVAANVLAIVRRELTLEDPQLEAELRGLQGLLGFEGELPVDRLARQARARRETERLCERIRGGEADTGVWRDAVLKHVRATVVGKLTVANPKLLGLRPGGD